MSVVEQSEEIDEEEYDEHDELEQALALSLRRRSILQQGSTGITDICFVDMYRYSFTHFRVSQVC